MRNDTGSSRIAAKPRAFWWPGVSILVLGIPLVAVLELLRRDPSYESHRFRLVVGFLILWLIAIVAFVVEYFRQHALVAASEIARDRLRLAMAVSNSAGWEIDAQTGKLFVFGDVQTVFGIPSETFDTNIQFFYQHVHPDDRVSVETAIDEAKINHTTYNKEFRIVRLDGAVRWVAAKGEFVYSQSGEPLRMLGTAVDITERKSAEEGLRISEQKFATVFRESPIAFTLTSVRDNRYIDVNDTYERLTGWSRAEVVGRTPFDINLWVDPEDRIQIVKRIQSGGPLRNTKIRLRRRDGREFVCLGSADLITIGDEDFLVSAVADITEQETMEQQLRESEQRFRGIVNSAMDAIIAIDDEQRVVLFNPAAEKMFLCTRAAAIGKPLAQFIPDRFRAEHELHIKHYRDSGVSTRTMGNLSVLYGLRGNEEFPIEVSISQINANGKRLFTAIVRDVSERRRRDEALRESEQRFSLAVQAGRMYVDEWDSSTDVIVRSPECVQVLGEQCRLKLTRTELLSQIHPQDREQFEQSFSELTPQHSSSQISYRLVRPDGKIIWLEKRVRGSFDTQGKLLRTIGLVADVSSRKEAEEALRESEDRFRRVVEHIRDAVVVDDVAGNIVFANDRFLDLFDFKREQLPNLKLEDYVAPEYRAELRDRHDRRLRGEDVPAHFEYQGKRMRGEAMWLEVDVVPIRDQAGKIIGTQSALRNITERKRSQQVLQESEERFRLLANSAPVMIWMADPDMQRVYVNDPWLTFTGRSRQQEMGQGWTASIHPDDLKPWLETYQRAFKERQPAEMQYRVRRHDGEYRWVLENAVPRLAPGGAFAGFIGSCIDITERKSAEEALADMGRRLIEAHEEERSWIARELHDDINQRIALLAIELENWSQHSRNVPSDFRAHIQQTQKGLLDLSKDVQALSHHLHSSKLEYLGIAAAAKSFCAELAEQRNVRITFHHSDIPRALGNEISLCLFRVLQEALQNAIKHSQAREFRVELRGRPDAVTLEVLDAGVGFDQRQVLRARGLGVTSMRERLKLVGGDLVIESALGQGTKVRARVPVKLEVNLADKVG